MELNILRSGSKPRAKLDKVQGEIAQLQVELHALQQGYVSAAEARERLRCALEWPVQHAAFAFESLLACNARYVALPAAIGLGEYAYLHGVDAFIEKVIAQISSKAGAPAEERTERLHALKQRLKSLFVAEEQEVLDLEQRGHSVLRRGDADVTVLLETWAMAA